MYMYVYTYVYMYVHVHIYRPIYAWICIHVNTKMRCCRILGFRENPYSNIPLLKFFGGSENSNERTRGNGTASDGVFGRCCIFGLKRKSPVT